MHQGSCGIQSCKNCVLKISLCPLLDNRFTFFVHLQQIQFQFYTWNFQRMQLKHIFTLVLIRYVSIKTVERNLMQCLHIQVLPLFSHCRLVMNTNFRYCPRQFTWRQQSVVVVLDRLDTAWFMLQDHKMGIHQSNNILLGCLLYCYTRTTQKCY